MTDISVALSASEVNRYAALFGDHHWPIRRSRSSKRGGPREEIRQPGCTGEHHSFFHNLFFLS